MAKHPQVISKKYFFHINLMEGTFWTCALKGASYWRVGEVRFPSVKLTLADVTDMYHNLGFSVTHCEIIEVKEYPGYDSTGTILVSGRKKKS